MTISPKNLGDGFHSFGEGLYLRVRDGKRLWFLRTTVDGKRVKRSIGPFPLYGIAAARTRAAELLLRIRSGEPLEQEETPAAAPYFRDIWEEAVENRKRVKAWTNEKATAQWSTTMQTYVLPTLGGMRVDEITRDDILRILSPIWQKKTATATKVRGRIEAVLDYAKARGWRDGENPASWKGNVSLFLPPLTAAHEVKHFTALDFDTLRKSLVPKLWKSGAVSYLAILFGCLTALRAQEFIRANWSEIEGDVFTVPWTRLKTGKRSRVPFRVPLSRQIRLVLERVKDLDEEVVFPGQAGKYLSLNTPRILIQRATGTEATMHGMRSVFRDWCAREGVDFTLAEKCLSHSVGDRTVQAYLRDDLLEKRREVMQRWADAIFPIK